MAAAQALTVRPALVPHDRAQRHREVHGRPGDCPGMQPAGLRLGRRAQRVAGQLGQRRPTGVRESTPRTGRRAPMSGCVRLAREALSGGRWGDGRRDLPGYQQRERFAESAAEGGRAGHPGRDGLRSRYGDGTDPCPRRAGRLQLGCQRGDFSTGSARCSTMNHRASPPGPSLSPSTQPMTRPTIWSRCLPRLRSMGWSARRYCWTPIR